MRFIILIIGFSFLLSNSIFATEYFFEKIGMAEMDSLPPKQNDYQTIVEFMPCFKGCEDIGDSSERKKCSDKKIIEYINENIIYPEDARKNDIEGMAVVKFIIEANGEISKAEILKNPGGGTGEEALRIINKMPNWNPGISEGKPVSVQFTLPVKFKLYDTYPADIKWSGNSFTGLTNKDDKGYFSKATMDLNLVKELFSHKVKGMPIQLKYNGKDDYHSQYYISLGMKGKKMPIIFNLKNSSTKKKILKTIKTGDKLYFYNFDFKKGFLEIIVE